MLFTDADRAWWKAVQYYVRNEDENLPPIGRFNYGQKLFFWLMFYGVILLLLSGLALWFVESIPWSLRWLRYLAVAVHVAVALATIGGFIIHVYMGTAMVRGGFTSIIRGEVSSTWARMHHRLWYEKVTQKHPDGYESIKWDRRIERADGVKPRIVAAEVLQFYKVCVLADALFSWRDGRNESGKRFPAYPAGLDVHLLLPKFAEFLSTVETCAHPSHCPSRPAI